MKGKMWPFFDCVLPLVNIYIIFAHNLKFKNKAPQAYLA